MLLVAFLRWWYGPGWRDAAVQLSQRLQTIYLQFSVPTLLRTLFAPWRRVTTPSGGSLSQRGKAVIDNGVSRLVGVSVRLLALLTAGLLTVGTAAIGGLLLVAWPLWPLAGLGLVLYGVVG